MSPNTLSMPSKLLMPSRQQGLSVIELMIAIALGITLMAASLQFIVSTRQTYELNDDISRIQENGRIAMDILSKDLRLAGYRPPLKGDGVLPDFFLKECQDSKGNNIPCMKDENTDIELTYKDGTKAYSDRLAVQFDPPPDDGTETTCLGTLAPRDSIITNIYTIQTVNGVNTLYCQGYDSTEEQFLDNAPMPLVDGIDNMQILYGIADSNDGDIAALEAQLAKTLSKEEVEDHLNSVTRYVSADRLTNDDMPHIRAVRVALLVSNGLADGFSDDRSRRFRLFDGDTITIKDRQPRRIYSTTVHFNNYGAL